MKLLVCGDRYWTDREYVYSILDYYAFLYVRKNDPIEYVIEGECTGADEFAGDWADSRKIPLLTREPWVKVRPNTRTSAAVNAGLHRGFPALWAMHRHAAGPIRNKEMLTTGKPDIVLAFHNDIEHSAGTKGMISLAEKAGVAYRVLAPDKLMEQADK